MQFQEMLDVSSAFACASVDIFTISVCVSMEESNLKLLADGFCSPITFLSAKVTTLKRETL